MNKFGSSTHGAHSGRTYDYEEKYPADKRGEELNPNARVWKVYNDETEAYDNEMYDKWKDTTDVLLVFTGLFSAIVTTFLVEASTAFNDSEQITASLLSEIILIQRALANGSSLSSIASSPLQPGSDTASASDCWINGLWLVSLLLALSAALITLLVKQWLHYYMSRVSGTPLDHAFTRHYRFRGLEKWHVEDIVELLPFLLHVSLFFFFTGLGVFVWQLNRGLLSIVVIIGTLTFTLYVAANLLPTLFSDCSYVTPLAQHVYKLYACLIQAEPFRSDYISTAYKSIQERESKRVHEDLHAAQLVVWLHSISANPTVVNICLRTPVGAGKFLGDPNLLTFRRHFSSVLLRKYEELRFSGFKHAERSELENLELSFLNLVVYNKHSVGRGVVDDVDRWRFTHILTETEWAHHEGGDKHYDIANYSAATSLAISMIGYDSESRLVEWIERMRMATPLNISFLIVRSKLLSYIYETYRNIVTIPPSIKKAAFQLFLQQLTVFYTIKTREDVKQIIKESVIDAVHCFGQQFTLFDSWSKNDLFYKSQDIAHLVRFMSEGGRSLWTHDIWGVPGTAWLLWELTAPGSDIRALPRDQQKNIQWKMSHLIWQKEKKILNHIFDYIMATVGDGKYISEDICKRAIWIRRVLQLSDDDAYQIYTYRPADSESVEEDDDEEEVNVYGRRCFRKLYISKVGSMDWDSVMDENLGVLSADRNSVGNLADPKPNVEVSISFEAEERVVTAPLVNHLSRVKDILLRWLGLKAKSEQELIGLEDGVAKQF